MSGEFHILVVDDEPRAVEMVARALRKLGRVETASSGDEAWAMARRGDFDLVVSDQRMPGTSGVELLTRISRHNLQTGRILITAYAEMSDTIAAINEGRIHAYLAKPCSPDEIRTAAKSVLDLVQRYARRTTRLLGDDPAMDDLRARIGQVGPGRFPVLILGETGTGKELVARSLHEQSPRSQQPFVALNCGALPESLLESELFGHRRGAFTGADRDKPGLFELANGGTLFLDEIGDTSPAMQVRLLRVLEAHEVRRVGDTETRPVDVRLVSATHRDIEGMVKDEEFRQDLFYRLNTVILHVPPLRARRGDIRMLAHQFAAEFGASQGRTVSLSESCLAALERLDFPGNVRELRGVVERGIAMALPGSEVDAHHLERLAPSGGLGADHPTEVGETTPASRTTEPVGHTLQERVEAVQTDAVLDALERFDGNRTRAAEWLGLSRPGLTKMIKRLGLDAAGGRR